MNKCVYLKMCIFRILVLLIPFVHANAQQLTAIKIGPQLWANENLHISTPNSWCYLEKEQYCEEYGKLYTWEAAKNACPAGWHLPSLEEWKSMIDLMGGEDKAALRLSDPANGFGLKYGGMAGIGNYLLEGNYCAFWTSTSYDKDHAWYLYLTPGKSNITLTYFNTKYGFSVRCLKN